MNGNPSHTGLAILELPATINRLFVRAERPLLPEAEAPVGLFVRYLRRKPGRGLAITYRVDGRLQQRTQTPADHAHRTVSLTLDETALAGSRIRFSAAEAEQAPVEVQPSGALRVPDLGIAVQVFPADEGLPALAASCTPTPESALFQALQAAAQDQLADPAWRLVSAQAEPVRYKPASRCVIRYSIVLERPGKDQPTSRKLTLFGKVYSDPQQAHTVQARQQDLYQEQLRDGKGAPLLPRPLGIIDAFGLTLNEAIQPPAADEEKPDAPGQSLQTGIEALQPQIVRGRGGEISAVLIPEEVLKRTASALARLHNSTLALDGQAPRTGTKEVKRLQERAALLAGYYPALAEQIQGLAGQLAERLEAARPDRYRPAHGGFKASQLLICGQQVSVVDFDGFCLADPALDVGYFLAYLRPSGLWYQRPGMRQWFEQAAAVFIAAYRQAMREAGQDQAALDGIAERSRLYEAALLFKIATRRVNRLNSPRTQELSALLAEMRSCLAGR